jgi:hypothetical protein
MIKINRRNLLKWTAGTSLAALSSNLMGCSHSSADEVLPISLRVPFGPTPVSQMGQTVYGYELYIGRVLSLGLSVSKVDILADGLLIKTYEDPELSQCLIKKARSFSVEEAVFTGRDYDVLFSWPTVSSSTAVASQLSHRVFFSNGYIAVGGSVAVKTGTTLIGPPVKGDGWWAVNGPSNYGIYHRRVIFDVNFKSFIAERFATDWLQFGSDGRINTGDGSKCTDFHCYGADLLAVADGTVVEARDGLPEADPPNTYAPTTFQNMFGNCVILDIGGRYAVYAHMIPGTVKVRVGDSVTKGQIIGNLGNSGNSSGPHLHFHLCSGRDGLASDGLPFSFARYDLLGTISPDEVDAGKIWKPTDAPQVRTAEMPLTDQVLKLY